MHEVHKYTYMQQRRRSFIVQILESGDPQTQEAIVEALGEMGIRATQATVSRDLNALGAVRGADGYQLAGASNPNPLMSSDLEKLVALHAISVHPADSLVVIKTAPGHAQLLAVGFDRTPPGEVVGCLAGDDTIFLATTSRKSAGVVVGQLTALMNGGTQ